VDSCRCLSSKDVAKSVGDATKRSPARGTWESHGWQWPSALRMTRTRLTGCARPHPRVLELASGAGSTILAAGGRGPLPPPQRLKSVVWVVAPPRAVPAPCCGEGSQQRTLWALWVRRRLCLGRLTDRGSGLQGTCKAKRTSIETKSSWGGARTCGQHQPVSMRVSAARRPRRLSGASWDSRRTLDGLPDEAPTS